ncbi:MAG: penicillin-binding protein 2, partial [Planctomycetota bacterium]|nr:penicillin-binding protein 2 [Planctomycetota bacterium]
YHPAAAGAVVMSPQSGDILAWACWPTYNPNNPGAAEGRHRLNSIIATVFEPGSTFKPFIWAAALEEKAITPEMRFFCENGAWTMPNGRVLHDVHGYGELTAEMVLVKSSNIGMAKIAALLGAGRLHRWIRAFGFGEITGVSLGGELSGSVHPLSRWTSYSLGSLPMGQEITVTLLQLATAYSAIANDGLLLKPRLVKAIRDAEGGLVHEVPIAVRRRVLQTETCAVLRRILRRAVSEGTGKAANMPEYALAGKTGTAQLKVNAEEYRAGLRGYSRTRYLSSFVGMAPAEEPRLVIAVAVREPKGAYYGGTVAAPVVRDIARRALLYLGVPPAVAPAASASDATLPVD